MNERRSLWLIAASVTGLLVATQSPSLLIIGASILVFVILSAVTPVAALMLLLILAPLRTLIATEIGFPLPLDVGQLLLLAFLAIWFLKQFVLDHSPLRLSWSPVYIPLLLFLAVTALNAFVALSLSAWIREWLKWLQILALAAVMVTMIRGRQWLWLIFGLVLAGAANALVGWYEFLGGSGALHLLINGRFFRAFGTFGQPNPFGGFMGILAPVALMVALGYAVRSWLNRCRADLSLAIFYGGGAMLLMSGILISWSRGAWLAFGVALAVMFLALPRRIEYGLALAGTLLGAFLVLWFAGLLPASIVARISSSTEEIFAFDDVRGVDITPENYPVVERLAHWQAALNMARDQPWLGVGLGNYEVAYPAYRLINWHEPLGHAHNYYLNMLAEGGLVSLLGYGKAWLLIMWLNWRARKHPDIVARFAAIGLLGAWTYLSVHSLFDNLYVNNLFLHLGLMLGILGVLYNQANSHVSLRSR